MYVVYILYIWSSTNRICNRRLFLLMIFMVSTYKSSYLLYLYIRCNSKKIKEEKEEKEKAGVFTTPCDIYLWCFIQRLESENVSFNSDNMDSVSELILASFVYTILLFLISLRRHQPFPQTKTRFCFNITPFLYYSSFVFLFL